MRVPIDASPALVQFNDAQPLTDALANLVSVLIQRPFELAQAERQQADAARMAEMHQLDLAGRRLDLQQKRAKLRDTLAVVNPKNVGQTSLDLAKESLRLRNLSGKAAGVTPTVEQMRAGEFGGLSEDDWLAVMDAEGKGATAREVLGQLRQGAEAEAAMRQQSPAAAELGPVMQGLQSMDPATPQAVAEAQVPARPEGAQARLVERLPANERDEFLRRWAASDDVERARMMRALRSSLNPGRPGSQTTRDRIDRLKRRLGQDRERAAGIRSVTEERQRRLALGELATMDPPATEDQMRYLRQMPPAEQVGFVRLWNAARSTPERMALMRRVTAGLRAGAEE